jgi:hypothetical protein
MTQANSNLQDFQGLIDRLIALCTKTIPNSEGFNFWYVDNEHYPYFAARLGDVDPAFDDEDEEIVHYTFSLFVRHFTGNRTGGLSNLGEGEIMLNRQIPVVINAILSSELFQSAPQFEDAPDWLETVDMLPCPGLQSADGKIFTTYTLECKARVQIDQTYE